MKSRVTSTLCKPDFQTLLDTIVKILREFLRRLPTSAEDARRANLCLPFFLRIYKYAAASARNVFFFRFLSEYIGGFNPF